MERKGLKRPRSEPKKMGSKGIKRPKREPKK